MTNIINGQRVHIAIDSHNVDRAKINLSFIFFNENDLPLSNSIVIPIDYEAIEQDADLALHNAMEEAFERATTHTKNLERTKQVVNLISKRII